MYLLSINIETGLIKDDVTEDSWKGIKVFRELVNKYGLEGLTTVALAVDYESPLRYYDEQDRGRRAVEEVYEDRNKVDLGEREFVNAIDKYKQLQFNLTLEQNLINQDIKARYIRALSKANSEEDDQEISRINSALQKHEVSIKQFEARFDRDKELGKAVTKNSYALSRIERDLENRKNSKFKNHGENIKNPNKLNLTS